MNDRQIIEILRTLPSSAVALRWFSVPHSKNVSEHAMRGILAGVRPSTVADLGELVTRKSGIREMDISVVRARSRLLDAAGLTHAELLEHAAAGRVPPFVAGRGNAVPHGPGQAGQHDEQQGPGDETQPPTFGEEVPVACKRRAVVVGIARYRRQPLKSCVNDAIAFRTKLVDEFDFEPRDIALLTDSAATKTSILGALRGMIADLVEGDAAVFYFSGHGTQVADTSFDESDHLDEAIVPYDGVEVTGVVEERLLVDDELRRLFEGVPNDVNLAVVFDSCNSATAIKPADDVVLKALEPSDHVRNLLDAGLQGPPTKHALLKAGSSHVLLAASQAHEFAIDSGPPHSLYTAQLLPALTRGRTYAEIHGAVAPNVVRRSRGTQNPDIEGAAGRKAFECLLVGPF